MNLATKDNASVNLSYGKANVGANWDDNTVMVDSLAKFYQPDMYA